MIALLVLTLLFAGNANAIEIEGVPFVKQETRFCGPAALSSVMAYYGLPIDQQMIGKAVYSEKIKGSMITDLEDYARRRDFSTRLDQGTLDDIRGFLKDKRPVIVLVDFGFWLLSKPHYLVITGYNAEGFIAHTGYESSRLFVNATFQKIWEKQGSVYLVIAPH